MNVLRSRIPTVFYCSHTNRKCQLDLDSFETSWIYPHSHPKIQVRKIKKLRCSVSAFFFFLISCVKIIFCTFISTCTMNDFSFFKFTIITKIKLTFTNNESFFCNKVFLSLIFYFEMVKKSISLLTKIFFFNLKLNL